MGELARSNRAPSHPRAQANFDTRYLSPPIPEESNRDCFAADRRVLPVLLINAAYTNDDAGLEVLQPHHGFAKETHITAKTKDSLP